MPPPEANQKFEHLINLQLYFFFFMQFNSAQFSRNVNEVTTFMLGVVNLMDMVREFPSSNAQLSVWYLAEIFETQPLK